MRLLRHKAAKSRWKATKFVPENARKCRNEIEIGINAKNFYLANLAALINRFLEVPSKVSKEIFDSIGPDLHGPQVCVADPKDRYRKKGNIQCIRSHDGSYSCTFGFDMITGKSIRGSIC